MDRPNPSQNPSSPRHPPTYPPTYCPLGAGLVQNLSSKVTNFTVCASPAALPMLQSQQGQQVRLGP